MKRILHNFLAIPWFTTGHSSTWPCKTRFPGIFPELLPFSRFQSKWISYPFHWLHNLSGYLSLHSCSCKLPWLSSLICLPSPIHFCVSLKISSDCLCIPIAATLAAAFRFFSIVCICSLSISSSMENIRFIFPRHSCSYVIILLGFLTISPRPITYS